MEDYQGQRKQVKTSTDRITHTYLSLTQYNYVLPRQRPRSSFYCRLAMAFTVSGITLIRCINLLIFAACVVCVFSCRRWSSGRSSCRAGSESWRCVWRRVAHTPGRRTPSWRSRDAGRGSCSPLSPGTHTHQSKLDAMVRKEQTLSYPTRAKYFTTPHTAMHSF